MRELFNKLMAAIIPTKSATFHTQHLQQMYVEESLIKLSSKEKAWIEEETIRLLNIQRRQKKLARMRGLPLPPAPGHITYAVYQ